MMEVTSDQKGEESFYLPAEPTTRLSVGTLVDRLESRGRWTLDLDMHMLDSDNWRHIIKARSAYLESQHDILLKDVFQNA